MIYFRSILCLVFVVMAASATAAQSQYSPDAPANTNNLKFTDLKDKAFDLQSLKGNVLLISFGATWCAPCSSELKALEELLKEYKDKSVKFLWVSIDSPREVSNKEIGDYAKKVGFTFPVLRDLETKVYSQFTSRARLPMVVFADNKGEIIKPIHFGMFSNPEDYKNHVRKRLNKILGT
jgi:peroxiredoxin